jgi:flagellar biosynthesis GTPase FlhF
MPQTKYLVRNDGVVFGYTASLAANPKFKVVTELPSLHVQALKEAKASEERRRGQAERTEKSGEQAIREAQERRKAEQEAAELAAQQQRESASEESQKDADFQAEEFVIASAKKDALVNYAELRFGVRLDSTRAVNDLRDEVRTLISAETQE